MKIGPSIDNLSSELRARTTQGDPKASEANRPSSPAASAAAGTQTTATISNGVRAAASGSEEVNLARIDSIREAIAEGRFPVDATKVADRLIEHAADLVRLIAKDSGRAN